jgi:hypothetical protein
MANQWFRFYAEFSSDPKVQMMPETFQRRLMMLFCFRCNGNETLHDDEIVFQLRVSPEEWQLTKAEFLRRNFIDNDNRILNWDKRQFVSDSSTARVSKHREKKKQECNVSVTPPEQNRTEQIITEKKEGGAGAPSLAKVLKIPKGTRINPDWQLPVEWGEWALQEGLTRQQVLDEELSFRDYWLAKSGKDAMKNDWQATWRNWVRRSKEFKRDKL